MSANIWFVGLHLLSEFSNSMNRDNLYLFASILAQDIGNPIRIDVYLSRRYPNTGRTQIQKQIENKWILINNKEVDKGTKVFQNDHIQIFTPYKSKIEWVATPSINPKIIFEDEQIIVVDKEAGMQIHPASGNHENTLINGLVAYLNTKNEKVFLVHRLDKFTSGLVVFAKTEEASTFLNDAFSKKEAKRKYYALTWGAIKEPGTIKKSIGRLPENQKLFGVLSKFDGGKMAITHYKPIQNFSFHTLIECELETGRTHQIRVHMKHNGNPLVGDFEYGGNKALLGIKDPKYMRAMDELLALYKGQALFAKELSFAHPKSKEMLHFTLDIPENLKKGLSLLEKVEEELLNHDDKADS